DDNKVLSPLQRGPANEDVPGQERDGRNHEHEENQTAFCFFSAAPEWRRSGGSFARTSVGSGKDLRGFRLCGRGVSLGRCLAASAGHRLLPINECSEQN